VKGYGFDGSTLNIPLIEMNSFFLSGFTLLPGVPLSIVGRGSSSSSSSASGYILNTFTFGNWLFGLDAISAPFTELVKLLIELILETIAPGSIFPRAPRGPRLLLFLLDLS
jgi:hypothetical protein